MVSYLLEVELLGNGVWMFDFTNDTKLFPKVVVPAYTLASSFVNLYMLISSV